MYNELRHVNKACVSSLLFPCWWPLSTTRPTLHCLHYSLLTPRHCLQYIGKLGFTQEAPGVAQPNSGTIWLPAMWDSGSQVTGGQGSGRVWACSHAPWIGPQYQSGRNNLQPDTLPTSCFCSRPTRPRACTRGTCRKFRLFSMSSHNLSSELWKCS